MVSLTKQDIDLVFNQPEAMGEFPKDQLAHMRALGKNRPFIFLAFAPKCAGTFFRAAIIYAINGQLLRMIHAQGGRDAQPYLPHYVAYYRGGVTPRIGLAHLHMMAHPSNCRFLEAFDIRPVIMIRPIPDMLASFSDMLDVDPVSRLNGLNCAIPRDYLDYDQKRKADYLLDIIGPWYVNYFVTWRRYVEEATDRVLVLDYRDIKDNPYETLVRTLDHCRIKSTPEQINMGLDKAWAGREQLRYNKGHAGRGQKFFDAGQLERLERLMQYYPSLTDWIDRLMGREESGGELESTAVA